MRHLLDRQRRAPAVLALVVLLLTLAAPFARAATPAPNPNNKPAEGKHYVVGTDTTFAPFEFRAANGDLVGIDMDLLHAIAQDQGFTVEVRSLGFDAAVQALQSRQVDAVMAGMSITEPRKQVFDFSDAYFDSGVQFAAPKTSSVNSLADLKGKRVAVKTGTAGADYADSVKTQYGFSTVAFGQTADMVNDVSTGNSAAYIDDFPVVAYSIQQGAPMKLIGEKAPAGSYGMAVNKGTDPELIAAFNQGLANIRANGEYDRVLAKYLGEQGTTQRTGFFTLLADSFPTLMKGLALTIAAAALSILFAMVLGVVFGFFKVSGNLALSWLATAYVAIFRGTPVLVQVFFFYFGIPAVTGITLTAFTAGVITLSLNAGAYMTEIVRGGIQGVDRGQMEAARSLGLPYMKAMNKVVLPQAIKIMTPSFINQFIITLKDTSLLAVIGLAELTYMGQQIIARNFRSFEMWLIIGVIYFIVIGLLTIASNKVDKRFNK
ncbi:amino acid ABC transporter substrate-binding protein, PAAT family /amino acid ABC transporter membrane protein, PAAT family [Raineyella antarctica]|uniref:Amino acid ABC transporter substrate-binding protein, PAAT family /amino acid ABC transporter membrane protein, PAAT family n=1 Tax=Raineyella antarctica TaxID=1577474 RepID=A0A1G6GD72_9ACTN|nr:ABC transporter substrate-binding protein/permease [Raineyella antarctica]SDB79952.1 amino acid ABC transporter substrate-binding protein, PAAT family /amino acid ABC transporter membrane protein, PAAT family [Raineyella antarctica]